MLLLPPHIRRRIEAHAWATYPQECCGILLGRGVPTSTCSIEEILEAANLAESRNTRYLLDPRQFLAADRHARTLGLEILGFYHSHPDHPPRPSVTDIAEGWEGYLYIIQSITATAPGELRAWRFEGASAREVPLPQGDA